MLTSELMEKIRRIEIRTRRLANDSFAGEYHSIFKGRGMEFDEVRPYLPGDDVRAIDWNVTARTGSPYIKRYVEERELTVMLVFDASRSGDFGTVDRFKRDLAAELAAVLAFVATTNNDKVGLLIFTDRVELYIPPRKGRRHVLRVIRDLLAFEPQHAGTDIKPALDTVNRVLKRRSVVCLISDFLAEPEHYAQALALTRHRHDVIAIDLNDPLENDFDTVGLLALEDAESGAVVWIDSNDSVWHTGFQDCKERRTMEKTRVFKTTGVDHVCVSTGGDYVDALAVFFQARARRSGRS